MLLKTFGKYENLSKDKDDSQWGFEVQDNNGILKKLPIKWMRKKRNQGNVTMTYKR